MWSAICEIDYLDFASFAIFTAFPRSSEKMFHTVGAEYFLGYIPCHCRVLFAFSTPGINLLNRIVYVRATCIVR